LVKIYVNFEQIKLNIYGLSTLYILKKTTLFYKLFSQI